MPDTTDPSSSATKAAPAAAPARMSIAGRAGAGARAGRAGRAGRSMPWVRRWVRNTFTRDQIASGLRSLLWVAPLTVLIWIYAEREQTTNAPVNIPIEVVSTDA